MHIGKYYDWALLYGLNKDVQIAVQNAKHFDIGERKQFMHSITIHRCCNGLCYLNVNVIPQSRERYHGLEI